MMPASVARFGTRGLPPLGFGGSSPLRRRDYIRRSQLLTHYATGRRQAHLKKGYSPYCLEGEFCELRIHGVLRSCAFFLRPDDGRWAVGVADYRLRYTSYKRPS